MPPEAPEELPSQCYYPLLSDEDSFVTENGKRLPVLHGTVMVHPERKPRRPNPRRFQAPSSAYHLDREEEKDLEIKRQTAMS